MSVSEVSICNKALGLLAQDQIISLTDPESIQADLCQRLYPSVRQEMLEAGDWSFAMKRAELAALSTAPEFGWDYKSQLPSDTLRVVGVWDNTYMTGRQEYRREEDTLLTNFSPVYVKYIFDLEDPNKFSPLFRKVLYTELAAQLCVPLTEDAKKEEMLTNRALFLLEEAEARDALQGSQERYAESRFFEVR